MKSNIYFAFLVIFAAHQWRKLNVQKKWLQKAGLA